MHAEAQHAVLCRTGMMSSQESRRSQACLPRCTTARPSSRATRRGSPQPGVSGLSAVERSHVQSEQRTAQDQDQQLYQVSPQTRWSVQSPLLILPLAAL